MYKNCPPLRIPQAHLEFPCVSCAANTPCSAADTLHGVANSPHGAANIPCSAADAPCSVANTDTFTPFPSFLAVSISRGKNTFFSKNRKYFYHFLGGGSEPKLIK